MMKTVFSGVLHLFLWFPMLCSHVEATFEDGFMRSVYLIDEGHHYLSTTGSIIQTLSLNSADGCGFECMRQSVCLSFNVGLYPDSCVRFRCELLYAKKHAKHSHLQQSSGFKHFSIYVSKSVLHIFVLIHF